MVVFEKFYRQNLIQIYTKTHQLQPFKKKIIGRGMPPNPPSKAHGFACKLPNLKKILLPLPNPGDAPDLPTVNSIMPHKSSAE